MAEGGGDCSRRLYQHQAATATCCSCSCIAVNSPAYVLLLSLIVYPRLPVVAVGVVRDTVVITLEYGAP